MKTKRIIRIISWVCMSLCFAMAMAGCAAKPSSKETTAAPTEEPDGSKSGAGKPIYRKITADEAKKIIDENADAVLLDVRTDEEYKEKRIDGSVLIPDNEIAERAEAELPDKDAVILIYCRSGRRSKAASDVLIDMGYTQVYDFGGIIDWPYETVAD